MSFAKNIREIPINGSIITVFQAPTSASFSISKDGTILSEGKYIQTDFSNAKKKFKNHQLAGNFHQEKFGGKIKKFLDSIEFPISKGTTPVSSILEYLKLQGYPSDDYPNLTTWVIVPKPNKSTSGKTCFLNTFKGLPDESFEYCSYKNYDLNVYMTKITPEVTEVKFHVQIPSHIYKKCMENNDVSQRPETNYIESVSLGTLHEKMREYGSIAKHISDLEKSSKNCKKMILISFKSSETSLRDNFNFSYLGQKISTSFNWCVIYEYSDSLNGTKKYFTWKKMMSGHNLSGLSEYEGLSGIVDFESSGRKSHLTNRPDGVLVQWTKEREEFLSSLEDNFRALSDKLNFFLSDLDDEKLTELISNSELKLIGFKP
jgi:hypothetical protein